MTILTYIVPFVFVLTVVVFFHELGHFLVGRWCGVKIDAFSIGFGPELWGCEDRYGTRWRVAAIPLGGYVKFHGDANGASVPDPERIEAMPEEERKVTFFAQPVWKRAAIVLAGPVANFVLAIVIFTVLFATVGRNVLTPRVASVAPAAPPSRPASSRAISSSPSTASRSTASPRCRRSSPPRPASR